MRDGLFSRPVEVTGSLARVVLEAGIDQPDGLTYAVPASMKNLEVGDRVKAPLGRGDRPVEGIVIEVFPPDRVLEALGDLDPSRIKPLIGSAARVSAADFARFPPNLVRLGLWISQYYCCPIGMVFAAMVPSAVKRQTGVAFRRFLERIEGAQPQDLPRSSSEALARVREMPKEAFPVDARGLADRLGHKTLSHVNRLIRAGVLRERVVQEVRAAVGPEWEAADGDRQPKPLTADQQRALNAIESGFGAFRANVLFGVTGSGKTEVYLQALANVLARGKSAIVLVPEISLTPQTAGRFLARFREVGVAVLHSGLSQSQRHAEWMRVMNGQARVVVGARSAIFAPVAEGTLGLIVVDEEHDGSYKQDQLPRYHGRDVAIRRAQMEGCSIILGSATPSLESWHNAASGRFGLLELSDRVGGGSLPPVRVVDMAEEGRNRSPADRRHQHSIGPALEAEIHRTLKGTGQLILLLNRRGYASYICCSDQGCGWYLTCEHCDVTAVYHKGSPATEGRGYVKCHHCLAETRLPAACPACGSRITTFGFGTQRLEDEIERKFPALKLGATMLRLDGDTMKRAADYFGALDRFRRGDIRALIGTQMIAKGLDFPNVELIGVINADTGLNMPDFRAEERTFQLIAQVAGRAGRSADSRSDSRVIVQSFSPGAASIRFASRHDFRGFAQREMGFRREAELPPVGRMARIVCRDEDGQRAENRAAEITRTLQRTAPSVRLRGPMACPISRIGGFYRFSVELLASSAGPIQQALAALRALGLVKSDAKTAVDVDPIALL
ncbi:MAG: primosomal protein N' [Phycisphaerae bacterium]|nr:primosomal protein N' [Phycisphaerae bacterium]